MAIEDEANGLMLTLAAGASAEAAFIALYAFVDDSEAGRFGWFQLGESAVFGVDCDRQIGKWQSLLRDSINLDAPVPDILGLASLGDTLASIVGSGSIGPHESKC